MSKKNYLFLVLLVIILSANSKSLRKNHHSKNKNLLNLKRQISQCSEIENCIECETQRFPLYENYVFKYFAYYPMCVKCAEGYEFYTRRTSFQPIQRCYIPEQQQQVEQQVEEEIQKEEAYVPYKCSLEEIEYKNECYKFSECSLIYNQQTKALDIQFCYKENQYQEIPLTIDESSTSSSYSPSTPDNVLNTPVQKDWVGTCWLSQTNQNPVWAASFPYEIQIYSIILENRNVYFRHRLSYVKVYIDNTLCFTTPDMSNKDSIEITECNGTVGSKIRLQQGTNELQFCGIKVLGKPSESSGVQKSTQLNLSIDNTQTSSSYSPSVPQAPITDTYNKDWVGTCWLSGDANNPKWVANFDKEVTIDTIRIENRNTHSRNRLSNVQVYIDSQLCYTTPDMTEQDFIEFSDCKGVKGSKITLQQGNQYLCFCGIKVTGY